MLKIVVIGMTRVYVGKPRGAVRYRHCRSSRSRRWNPILLASFAEVVGKTAAELRRYRIVVSMTVSAVRVNVYFFTDYCDVVRLVGLPTVRSASRTLSIRRTGNKCRRRTSTC